MVENCDFLKRLWNVHLEKSVATGICRVRRSPKTAKTPRKVHLRLRFFCLIVQNDCGLEIAESPALRGFVGGLRALATAALYLVIFSNGDITPQNTFKTGINAP